MPFREKNMKQLVKSQESKSFDFSESLSKSLSDDVKVLINGTLEPDVEARLNIQQVQQSYWLIARQSKQNNAVYIKQVDNDVQVEEKPTDPDACESKEEVTQPPEEEVSEHNVNSNAGNCNPIIRIPRMHSSLETENSNLPAPPLELQRDPTQDTWIQLRKKWRSRRQVANHRARQRLSTTTLLRTLAYGGKDAFEQELIRKKLHPIFRMR